MDYKNFVPMSFASAQRRSASDVAGNEDSQDALEIVDSDSNSPESEISNAKKSNKSTKGKEREKGKRKGKRKGKEKGKRKEGEKRKTRREKQNKSNRKNTVEEEISFHSEDDEFPVFLPEVESSECDSDLFEVLSAPEADGDSSRTRFQFRSSNLIKKGTRIAIWYQDNDDNTDGAGAYFLEKLLWYMQLGKTLIIFGFITTLDLKRTKMWCSCHRTIALASTICQTTRDGELFNLTHLPVIAVDCVCTFLRSLLSCYMFSFQICIYDGLYYDYYLISKIGFEIKFVKSRPLRCRNSCNIPY